MAITFSNPEFLWLLLSVPLLVASHFLVARNLKTSAWTFANYEAIVRITGGKATLRNAIKLSRNIILLAIKSLVMLFLVLSAAGMTFSYSGTASNSDFVVAIDASSSMLAQDFSPSRFEAAKSAARLFVDKVHADASIGVIAFSGTSLIQLGMTRDKFIAKHEIDAIEISRTGGTDLGEAIITSSNMLRLREGGDRAGAVVLLTDGRSTVGTDIREGISYAREKAVTMHTVGIATEQGGSFANIELISTIDEESLRAIASQTGGSYHRAEDEQELEDAFADIASRDKALIPVELRMPFLLLALALIFVEWGLASTKFRTLP